MRLFYLQNELGNRIPLNNETGIFLTDPDGLGLTFGDTFADIGEGFFRMVSKKHSQRAITAKLNFFKDPYKLFNDFINWCMAAKDLYFIYKPMTVEYYIHVEIASVDKKEINKLGYLESSINLKYLSPWYVPTPASISMMGSEDSGFIMDESRLDGSDVLVNSTAESYTTDIVPYGHLPAAIKIAIKGTASNPVFRLRGVTTGIEYGKCAINKSFSDETTVELSTMYENSYVKSIDILGFEEDLLPYVDLTGEPFFKVPLTEPCRLTITDDESLQGSVKGSVYYYYRSV